MAQSYVKQVITAFNAVSDLSEALVRTDRSNSLDALFSMTGSLLIYTHHYNNEYDVLNQKTNWF